MAAKKNLFIPVILGTGRENSRSQKIAEFIAQALKDQKVNTELIFISDFATLVTTRDEDDPQVQAWRAIAAKADGFLIVAPEYNRGYPGELKILLDKAKEEYYRKPVAFCTVSHGRGGVRASQQLEWTAIGLKMVPVPKSVYFTHVTDQVSDQELHETYGKDLEQLFFELLWFATTLKAGR